MAFYEKKKKTIIIYIYAKVSNEFICIKINLE